MLLRLSTSQREGLGIMLKQMVDIGEAEPSARSALAKIQKTKSGIIDFSQVELQQVLDTYEAYTSNKYRTPLEDRRFASGKVVTVGPVGPPTRYLDTSEQKRLESDLFDMKRAEDNYRWYKLESLGVHLIHLIVSWNKIPHSSVYPEITAISKLHSLGVPDSELIPLLSDPQEGGLKNA